MRSDLWVVGALATGCIGTTGTTGTTNTTSTNTTPPAPFACGGLTCAGDQVCVETIPGVKPETGSVRSEFTCADAPAGCAGTPDCACVAEKLDCPHDCDDSGDGVRCTVALP